MPFEALVGPVAIEVVVKVLVDKVDIETVLSIGIRGKGWLLSGGLWIFVGFDVDVESETGTTPDVVLCFTIPGVETCFVGFASLDV